MHVAHRRLQRATRRARHAASGGVLLLVLLSSTSVAWADAVPPGPGPSCPAGSSPDRHEGTCVLAECDARTCGADCHDARLCVLDGIDGATGDPQSHVTGDCAAGQTCASGTCRSVRVCIRAPAATSTSSGGACSVAVGSSEEPPTLVLTLSSVFLSILGARRTRRRWRT